MPVTINYAAQPKSPKSKNSYLPDSEFHYGYNEIYGVLHGRYHYRDGKDWNLDILPGGLPAPNPDQSTLRRYLPGVLSVERKMHFILQKKCTQSSSITAWGEKIHAVHSWLNQNITSPWLLDDFLEQLNDPAPHTRFNCEVHIERFDERKKFAEAHKDIAVPQAVDPVKETQELAMLKGVIPPYSFEDNLLSWVERYKRGYNWEKKTINDAEYHIIRPECELAERSIERNLVDKGWFTRTEEGLYICPEVIFAENQIEMATWQSRSHAIKSYDKAPNNLYTLAFRSDQHEAMFVKKWGKHFEYNEKENYYHCKAKAMPPLPQIDVPEKFNEYLDGRVPDPSLKPL